VGKTTAAAAIGVEAARRGRRAVVVTIDPARRLADALGMAGGLGAEPAPLSEIVEGDGTGELWAMMLDTSVAFTAVVRRHAVDEDQADRILANPFFRNMVSTLGGTQEYMAVETVHQLHADERFDLVVVDTPPSRNAIEFLEAPGVLARFLDHRLFRLSMLPAQRGMRLVGVASQPVLRMIGKVVGSEVLGDAITFFQAFAGMEAGFRQRAEDVTHLLRAATTRYLVVTSPRRDAVTEATWFAAQLHRQGIEHVAGLANRIHPDFGDGTDDRAQPPDALTGPPAPPGDPALAALSRNLSELRARRAAELDQLRPFLERFEGAGPGWWAEVPLLPADVHDREGLAHVGRHLFSAQGEGPF
jgi:anion-transporting  ArsA/GET3 family ATPase